MEENKKENNQERVKIYDKDMYISQEKIRTIIIMVIVFLIGFVAGYFSKGVISESIENESKIDSNFNYIIEPSRENTMTKQEYNNI